MWMKIWLLGFQQHLQVFLWSVISEMAIDFLFHLISKNWNSVGTLLLLVTEEMILLIPRLHYMDKITQMTRLKRLKWSGTFSTPQFFSHLPQSLTSFSYSFNGFSSSDFEITSRDMFPSNLQSLS